MTYPKYFKGFAAILLGLALLAASGCERANEISAREIIAMKTRLSANKAPEGFGDSAADPARWQDVQAFYTLRNNRPAWIQAGKLLPSVDQLRAVLQAAADEGLDPREYGAEAFETRELALKRAKDVNALIDFELDLTFRLLLYGSHLANGHPIARQIDANWTVTPRTLNLVERVQDAVSAEDLKSLARTLAPPQPEYSRLREMRQRYRQIDSQGELRPIPTDLKLVLGVSDPNLAALRGNLLILGDLQERKRNDDNVFDEDLSAAQKDFDQRNATQPDTKPDVAKLDLVNTIDKHLSEAVRRFEARHGLNPDGVPDPGMIAAMNISAGVRAEQLALNMERWRWLPEDFGTPHLFVNIASYRLQVRDADEDVPLRMRVIAGKPEHRTPIFSDVMDRIVFSPYWNIPESIEIKEMWPLIAKDPAYLSKKQIEVVRYSDGKAVVVAPSSIDWSNPEDARDFQLRQKSGPSNSLGFVKFMFPNRHNVYLHDTPADNLFDKLTRDLSHGCVRLEQPAELASYLLRDQAEWTAARIKAAMNAGEEEHVQLKTPIPVHLVYLTARVDEDGVAQFFDDPYGYDVKQQALLKLR